VGIKQGDLIRWVIDWGIYTVAPDGDVNGRYPQYCHGIVMEVSVQDPQAIVVHCYDCGRAGTWTILHILHDDFEVLSTQGETFDDKKVVDVHPRE